MPSPDRHDRLMQATADAVRAAGSTPPGAAPASPAPGDLLLFRLPTGVALEWAVVRVHPDDPGLVFVVPADDYPLAGPADVTCSPSAARRQLALRCGEGAWVEVARHPMALRVGAVPPAALAGARHTLAALARAEPVSPADPARRAAERDRGYRAWMRRVAAAREALESTPGVVRLADFQPAPPDRLRPLFTPAAELSLAAAPGDPLMAAVTGALTGALTGPVGDRYLELGAGVTLRAVAEGVCAYYHGAGDPPALGHAPAEGGATPLPWRRAPDGAVWGSALVPWDDSGTVILQLGTPGQEVRVQR